MYNESSGITLKRIVNSISLTQQNINQMEDNLLVVNDLMDKKRLQMRIFQSNIRSFSTLPSLTERQAQFYWPPRVRNSPSSRFKEVQNNLLILMRKKGKSCVNNEENTYAGMSASFYSSYANELMFIEHLSLCDLRLYPQSTYNTFPSSFWLNSPCALGRNFHLSSPSTYLSLSLKLSRLNCRRRSGQEQVYNMC